MSTKHYKRDIETREKHILMIKIFVDPGSVKGAMLIENSKTGSVVVKSFILDRKN